MSSSVVAPLGFMTQSGVENVTFKKSSEAMFNRGVMRSDFFIVTSGNTVQVYL